ncbi:MAG: peptidase M16 [Ectothiorhodospiraceae bacterium]|nr:peptidase M16 [Ectothiorhodospiraceae bacterium]
MKLRNRTTTQRERMSQSDITGSYRKTALESGLRIVTESIPSLRSVSIGVWINVGSRDESAEESGISHFVEHAVFKGTASRKTHHIAQYLETVGGYLNAFTTKDATCYYARILERHIQRAVNILADLVVHPAFREKEIGKEKNVILDEMRGIEDDQEDVINDHLDGLLFGKNPLSQPVIGTKQAIEDITQRSLFEFTRQHYTSDRIVIAAAGAVDHDELVRLVSAAFEGIPSGDAPKRRKPRTQKPKQVVLRKPIQQSHIMMGTTVPGTRSSASSALHVINTALGEGMSSRLFQRVRERFGYAYNVYSYLTQFEDTGVFGVYAGSENGSMDRAHGLIRKELETIRAKGLSSREIRRAKEQLIGGLIIGLESMDSRMHRIGKDELHIGEVASIDSLIDRVSSVTVDEVRQLCARFCDPAQYSEVRILPA